jgi:hypothetical protein
MNAVNGLTRVMVCGAVAMALTVTSAWAFVESNKTAHWPADMPTVVILAKAEQVTAKLAQASASGLLQ